MGMILLCLCLAMPAKSQAATLEGTRPNVVIIMTDNGAASGSLQLKGRKTFATEGGIRVPCIMYWKGHVEGGISNNDLAGHIDYYATFAELAGSDDAVPGGQMWDGRA